MPDESLTREQIERFIVDKIDTVPQLEALLLLWRGRPRPRSIFELARELYLSPDRAAGVLEGLLHMGLIVPEGAQSYALNLVPKGREKMLTALEELYRHELLHVSHLIHDKAPRAVRDFARAFRFKKEEDK